MICWRMKQPVTVWKNPKNKQLLSCNNKRAEKFARFSVKIRRDLRLLRNIFPFPCI